MTKISTFIFVIGTPLNMFKNMNTTQAFPAAFSQHTSANCLHSAVKNKYSNSMPHIT
jgi:hypothetical protein